MKFNLSHLVLLYEESFLTLFLLLSMFPMQGRTGVMICALLLHQGTCETSADAMEYYGEMRTKDGKVTHVFSVLWMDICNDI